MLSESKVGNIVFIGTTTVWNLPCFCKNCNCEEIDSENGTIHWSHPLYHARHHTLLSKWSIIRWQLLQTSRSYSFALYKYYNICTNCGRRILEFQEKYGAKYEKIPIAEQRIIHCQKISIYHSNDPARTEIRIYMKWNLFYVLRRDNWEFRQTFLSYIMTKLYYILFACSEDHSQSVRAMSNVKIPLSHKSIWILAAICFFLRTLQ